MPDHSKAAQAAAKEICIGRYITREEVVPAALIIERHYAPLEAKCEALHEALRSKAIYSWNKKKGCTVCHKDWKKGAKEIHAEGCLAAPKEPDGFWDKNAAPLSQADVDAGLKRKEPQP